MPLRRRSPAPLLPLARQQHLVAECLDLGRTTWQPLADGSTSAVFRAVEHGLVVRFSNTPTRVEPLRRHLARAGALVAAAVPFAAPAVTEPLVLADPNREGGPIGAATVWHDLGPSQQVDYEQFGHTVRLLHDDGTRALADDPDLRAVADFDHLRLRLDRAVRRGALAGPEHDLLAPWIDRMEDTHPGHPAHASRAVGDGGAVLVHDDVWPKNLIQTQQAAHLLDPDNLAWGAREHDLSFIARAYDSGRITAEEITAFEDGYGRRAPSASTAWTHAYVHRIRWVLDLVESRHLPEPQRMLRTELPLWSLPRGPRDDPSI